MSETNAPSEWTPIGHTADGGGVFAAPVGTPPPGLGRLRVVRKPPVENAESAVLRAIAELEADDDPDEVAEIVLWQLKAGEKREKNSDSHPDWPWVHYIDGPDGVPFNALLAAAQEVADYCTYLIGLPRIRVPGDALVVPEELRPLTEIPAVHAPGILGLIRDAVRAALQGWRR